MTEVLNAAFWQNTFQFALLYGLFALAVYVSLASGVLSIASVAIGALTGFVATDLTEDRTLPLLVLVLGGAVLGAIAAFLMFLMLQRLASHYFVMATIAFVLVARVIVLNAPSITGGSQGHIVSYTVDTWALVVTVVVAMAALMRLRGSALWLAFDAVRADPDVAAGMGIDPARVQRISFVISGVLGGVGGVLLAGSLQFISPTTYGLDLAFTALAAAVLGGAYHWAGPMVGAFILTALPGFLGTYTTRGVQLINGVMILVIVIAWPHGIVDKETLQSLPFIGERVRRRSERSDGRREIEAAQP